MGVQHNFGTAGATGGGYSTWQGTLQAAFAEAGDLVPPGFSWQRRSTKTWRDRNAWISLWPAGCVCGNMGAGPGTDAMAPIAPGGFEPFSCDGAGTQTLKFIKGRVVDSSDVAVAGAIVQAHRTSDDAFGGYEVQSRLDGSFDCPTQFGAVNHFVVAYKAGSPDVGGTTVNTLVPANIDGT